MKDAGSAPRILVIRRDNIGDLVCTTPLIRALRAQLPAARIVALATRYNAATLAGNPDLDAVCAYTKAKHRGAHESLLAIHAHRLRMMLELRREHFHWVLLPGGPHSSALWFARFVGGARTLVRGPSDAVAGPHEVEQCCHLLVHLGLRYEAPPARVVPDAAASADAASLIRERWPTRPPALICLHISARKPSQRWAPRNFAEVARQLHAHTGAAFLLLWAPGGSDDRLHPGDDDKARLLQSMMGGIPVLPVATHRLEQLIAALAQCDAVICGDGGAMHLAAALGKPVVCLFGQSDPERWRPWRTPHELLQKQTRDVRDIPPQEVVDALLRLQSGRQSPAAGA